MRREVEKLVMAERNEGHAEGAIESSARAVLNLVEKMSFSVEEAMAFLELSEAGKEAVRTKIEW